MYVLYIYMYYVYIYIYICMYSVYIYILLKWTLGAEGFQMGPNYNMCVAVAMWSKGPLSLCESA